MSYLGQDGASLTTEQIKAQQQREMQAQQLALQREHLVAQALNAQALVQGHESFLQSIGAVKPVAAGVPYQAQSDWTVPAIVLVSLLGMAAIGGGFLYLVKSKSS